MEETLKNLVENALPDLTGTRSADVATYLVNDVGITCMERLDLIREEDLQNAALLPAEARLFLLALRPPEPLEHLGGERGRQQGPGGQDRRPQDQDCQRETATQEQGWNFALDWEDIKRTNHQIIRRLQKGKKLNSRLRREFVARVVYQVRTRAPGATRRIFVSVMSDIKRKYSASFCHELANGKVGKQSITKKLMDKFDNDKRPPRRTVLETEAPALKAAYGCIKWRVPLPVGQTSELQEQTCEGLKEYFSNTRPTRYDWGLIEAQMTSTYSTQRKDINSQAEALERLRKANVKRRRQNNNRENENEEPDNPEEILTAGIADKWPFLFQARGMRMHFNELTGINFAACIEKLASSNQLDQLLEFSKESLHKVKPARKILKKLKAKLKSTDVNQENKLALQVLCLIRLIIIFFKEDESELLLFVESTTLEEDVVNECRLPKTPSMIIAGNFYEPTKIFFSLDGTLLGTAKTLLEGLELVFCSYFVFNLVYAPKIQISLEFIQRVILEMIPARGHKRPAREAGGRYSTLKEHLHLSKFSMKFEEFLAGRDSSSLSSGAENEDDPV